MSEKFFGRRSLAQPVFVFASSRKGVEDALLEEIMDFSHVGRAQAAINSVAYSLRTVFKALIAPRHPQRFDEVAALVERHSLRVSRRSQWEGGPAASNEAINADVCLGDSLGEMALERCFS